MILMHMLSLCSVRTAGLRLPWTAAGDTRICCFAFYQNIVTNGLSCPSSSTQESSVLSICNVLGQIWNAKAASCGTIVRG